MLFEPAIIEFTSHMASHPPAIVREAFDFRGEVQTFVRKQLEAVSQLSTDLDQWIEDGRRLRTDFWKSAIAEAGKRDLTATLAKLVETADEFTNKNAKMISYLRTGFRREQKEAYSIAPAAGAALRQVDEALIAVLERELSARSEFGLFLRALQSEIVTDRPQGRTFSDAKSLERALLRRAS